MVGCDGDELRYLAVSVVPMGWLSAVGVCQACLRRLVESSGVPPDKELRKDRAMPTEHFQRVLKFHREYVDNFDSGSVLDRGGYMTGAHDILSDMLQAQVTEGYKDWGVPRSEEKSTAGLSGVTLG